MLTTLYYIDFNNDINYKTIFFDYLINDIYGVVPIGRNNIMYYCL